MTMYRIRFGLNVASVGISLTSPIRGKIIIFSSARDTLSAKYKSPDTRRIPVPPPVFPRKFRDVLETPKRTGDARPNIDNAQMRIFGEMSNRT